MHKRFLFGVFLMVVTQAFADIPVLFKKYLETAKGLQSKVQQAAATFHPETQLKGYSAHPKEAQYYRGVAHPPSPQLAHDSNVNQSPTKKMVQKSFDKRPVFSINPDSDALQRGKLIEENAGDIARGLSNKYINCEQTTRCTTTFQTKVCNEVTRFITQRCIKTPTFRVVTVPKTYAHCRHLVTRKISDPAPENGEAVGPWYPCPLPNAGSCMQLYLVPGAEHERCIVSAVSVFGSYASQKGPSVTIPAGFPVTLRLRTEGMISKYGYQHYHLFAKTSTGISVQLFYNRKEVSKKLGIFSKDTSLSVDASVATVMGYWSRYFNSIGLATLEIPSHIPSEKIEVNWQEDCRA